MRATMSTGPPGAVGRIRRTGLTGKLCAWLAIAQVRLQASAAAARAIARSNVGGFVMNVLPTFCMTAWMILRFPIRRNCPRSRGFGHHPEAAGRVLETSSQNLEPKKSLEILQA